MDDNPTVEELRRNQLRRELAERELSELAELEDDTKQHARRADKAGYLRDKLAERAEAEREAAGGDAESR